MNPEVKPDDLILSPAAQQAVARAILESTLDARWVNQISFGNKGEHQIVLSLAAVAGLSSEDGEDGPKIKVHGSFVLEREALERLGKDFIEAARGFPAEAR